MKYQILFSRKKKKKFKMSSAENFTQHAKCLKKHQERIKEPAGSMDEL